MQARKPPASEVSAELPMTNADEKLWVMKVPKFLMDHLQKCNATAHVDQGLGTVTQDGGAAGSKAHAAGGATSFTLTLPESGLADGMPREYEFRFQEPPPATYVFSRKADGTPEQHEGRVSARGEIRPKELTAAYRRLLKERGDAAQASAKGRQVAIVRPDEEDELKQQARGGALSRQEERKDEKEGRAKKQEKRVQNANKRARPTLSKEELKEALNDLFAKKPHWSRADMAIALGVPIKGDVLSAVLEERCDKITTRNDPKYGDYELKPAFRSGLPGTSAASLPKP